MKVTKVGTEWCAFADNGREVARSHDKKLLEDYLKDGMLSELLDTGTATLSTPEATTTIDYKESTMPSFAKVSYRTRARSTGASTASGRTTDKGWAAMCVSHGTMVVAEAGMAAEKLTSKPEEWCPTCAEIKQGIKPKVTKNAELDDLL